MTDLRTENEKRREAKFNRICNRYLAMVSSPEYARYSPSRLMTGIANEEGCTMQNVKNILIQMGVYTPKK